MAQAQENIEFIDCSTISIQYEATGRATLSFTVVRSDTESLKRVYTTITFGNVTFQGVLMSANKKPVLGGEGWTEWQLSIQGVGN